MIFGNSKFKLTSPEGVQSSSHRQTVLEKIKINQVASYPHLNSFVSATNCVCELVARPAALEKLDLHPGL